MWTYESGEDRGKKKEEEATPHQSLFSQVSLPNFLEKNCLGCRFVMIPEPSMAAFREFQKQGWCIRPETPTLDPQREACYSREEWKDLPCDITVVATLTLLTGVPFALREEGQQAKVEEPNQ